MTDRDTTAAIHGLLRLRHETGRGEWALFEEFQPGTGSSSTSGRRWDVLAIACWGEGKGRRICYEIKASRRDWLTELKNPGKRVLAETLCHETWIAAAPGVVESIGELPEGWGWLEVHGSVLRCVRSATQRAKVESPDSFIAALARRGAEDGERNPPPPPRGAWRFAGREVSEAALPRVCAEIVGVNVEAQVRGGVERQTSALNARVQRLEAMEAIISREMGLAADSWRFNAAGLEIFLAAHREHGAGGDASRIAGKLEELAQQIRSGHAR